ncbi:unnamed protein product, partial [Symbiodinium sp. KB8]
KTMVNSKFESPYRDFHHYSGDICAYNKATHNSQRLNTFNTPGKLQWKKAPGPAFGRQARPASAGIRRPRGPRGARRQEWTEDMSTLVRRMHELMDVLRCRLEEEADSPISPMPVTPPSKRGGPSPKASLCDSLEKLEAVFEEGRNPSKLLQQHLTEAIGREGQAEMNFAPRSRAREPTVEPVADAREPLAERRMIEPTAEPVTVATEPLARSRAREPTVEPVADAREPLAERRMIEPTAEPVTVATEPLASRQAEPFTEPIVRPFKPEPVSVAWDASHLPATAARSSPKQERSARYYFENLTVLARIVRQLSQKLQARVSLFGEPLDGPYPNVERLRSVPTLYSAAWEDIYPGVERFHEASDVFGPRSRPDGYLDRFELADALRRLDIFVTPQDVDSLVSCPATVDLLQLTLQKFSESRRYRSYFAPPKMPPRSPSLSGLLKARASGDRRWTGEGV